MITKTLTAAQTAELQARVTAFIDATIEAARRGDLNGAVQQALYARANAAKLQSCAR